jgi:ABC-type dipeptide/oligopeptide/nickel transport system permease subunit
LGLDKKGKIMLSSLLYTFGFTLAIILIATGTAENSIVALAIGGGVLGYTVGRWIERIEEIEKKVR